MGPAHGSDGARAYATLKGTIGHLRSARNKLKVAATLNVKFNEWQTGQIDILLDEIDLIFSEMFKPEDRT
jgi:hypothetical protein